VLLESCDSGMGLVLIPFGSSMMTWVFKFNDLGNLVVFPSESMKDEIVPRAVYFPSEVVNSSSSAKAGMQLQITKRAVAIFDRAFHTAGAGLFLESSMRSSS